MSILFSPGTVDPGELDARTVGRRPCSSDSPSGSSRPPATALGRTPCRSVRAAAVRRTPSRWWCTAALSDLATADSVLALRLPEDALSIGHYGDLLVELIRPYRPQAGELRTEVIELERVILDIADGRMVLLVIENLDRVFDAIGESGQGSLRAWVETSTAVSILGTAPALFPGVASRTHPWYGPFIIEELDDLTAAEGAQIIAPQSGAGRLRRHPEGRNRLESIREFAGARRGCGRSSPRPRMSPTWWRWSARQGHAAGTGCPRHTSSSSGSSRRRAAPGRGAGPWATVPARSPISLPRWVFRTSRRPPRWGGWRRRAGWTRQIRHR